MTTEVAATHDADHEHGEVHLDNRQLLQIGGYLLVLTMATFFTFFLSGWLWGPVTNTLFVLMIGFCKASLVVGFFMHYKFEKNWKYYLTIPPTVLLVVGICALLPDIAFHTWERVPWNQ